MSASNVTDLFNPPHDREGAIADIGSVAGGRTATVLSVACYMFWITLCVTGPALSVGGDANVVLQLPCWIIPLGCMGVANGCIAVFFKRTRRVADGKYWPYAVALFMAAAALFHCFWVLGTREGTVLAEFCYVLSSLCFGVGGALFRVQLDRIFGWIGMRQTIAVGLLGTLVLVVALSPFTVSGFVSGRFSHAALYVVSVAVPFLLAWLVKKAIQVFPHGRYFNHGREVPLPFPTKFVCTSAVQGIAAGLLYSLLFFYGESGNPTAPQVLAGNLVGVVALFVAVVFLRLDFNRLIYKVAFPFVALGFLAMCLSGDMENGFIVIAAAFCFLDLVLWSLGACLIKNLGLPATWVATCPGASLVLGAVGGGILGMALPFLMGPSDLPLWGSLAACGILACALFLSSGSNMRHGWGMIRPSESSSESDDLSGAIDFMATDAGVTQREREVMQLLVEGKSRSEICEALTISPDTVKTHVRGVYRKIGVHSQQELIDKVRSERDRLFESDEPVAEAR